MEKANLPEGTVSLAAISDKIPSVIGELINNFHISVVTPAPIRNIKGSERFHADMSLCHLGMNSFIIEPGNIAVASELIKLGAKSEISDDVTAVFPGLNVCLIDNIMVCNEKTADVKILTYCRNNNKRIIQTNQMYTKCSTAIITKDAVITSDESIYKVCIKEKLDVIKVDNRGIRLEGYNYGFIGGCCGLISKDTLAFSGRIEDHPDYYKIKDFTLNHGVYTVSLGNTELYDIGGILPILERI